MSQTGVEVRCQCSTRPLLARAGRDDRTGEPWVHIKSWKGGRLYVEAVVSSGVVKIKCRECLRWQRIKIVRGAPILQAQNSEPAEVA